MRRTLAGFGMASTWSLHAQPCRQQVLPVNRRNRRIRRWKRGVRPQPWGLNAHSHDASLPTGENVRHARTLGMLRIRAKRTSGATVNRIGATSLGIKLVAPRHGFEPRFTAPKAAVLPLDDRGKSEEVERLLQCSRP